MCGIIGIIGPEAKNVGANQIAQALKCIAHRGPDDQSTTVLDGAVLSHARLSIIDTRAIANQPMFDGELTILFNGEIYNYAQVRSELLALGHEFKTTSDTEVVLKAYREWGDACVEKFIGMWAFAIYNTKTKQAFLSRDRIGEKPLYYTIHKDTLYFASEIPSLVALGVVDGAISGVALTYYFTYNMMHTPWDNSIFAGIKKLPPAHTLTFTKKGVALRNYWKPDFTKKRKTQQEYTDEYAQVFEAAVKRTAVSDVPLGILLSGGVDSSSIAAVLKDQKPVSYTIGFNKKDPELARAARVAKKLGIPNKQILFSSDEVLKNGPKHLRRLVRNLGEPINLLQPLYTSLIMKEVHKDGIKVIIGGNGADEIFFGYDGVNNLVLASKLFALNDAVPILKWLRLSRITKGGVHTKLKLLELDNAERKPYLYSVYAKQTLELFSPQVRETLLKTDFGSLPRAVSKRANAKTFIESSQWLGLAVENEHSITIVADLGGMAESIEVRTPFLDKELMEFGFHLPVKYKARSAFSKQGNKWIMRRYMERVLGKEFLYKNKMGFGFNISRNDLVRTHWNKDVQKTVLGYLPKTGLFDNERVQRLYDEHMNGANHGHILIGLFIFGLWHEEMSKTLRLHY